MYELAILAIVVAALMAATTLAVQVIGPALRILEQLLLIGAILIVLFVMVFVGAEVLMRYAFNSPIPGHLEGSELLVPMIVFLALSFTQATHGHIGIDIVLDALPPRGRRLLSIGSLIVSIFVCAVLAYFSFKNALQLWRYDDVTMTPPYFRTWPAAAAIPLGYGLTAFRMYLQVLHLADAERFPTYEPDRGGFHAAD